jgi:hypothetical protein
MKPRERRDSGQGDLLRSRLDAILDMDHQLVVLARKVDWGFLEERLGEAYRDGPGQPPLPTQLTAALTILKYTYDLSDEELCARWLYYEGTRSDGVHFADRGVSFHSTHGQCPLRHFDRPKPPVRGRPTQVAAAWRPWSPFSEVVRLLQSGRMIEGCLWPTRADAVEKPGCHRVSGCER